MACLATNLLFSGVTSAHSLDDAKCTPINSTGYSESCISSLNDKDSVINYSSDNPFKGYHYNRGSHEDNPFKYYREHHRSRDDDNPFKGYHYNRGHHGHSDDYYKPQF
ncbi:MAG: hypothetical protein IKZ58_06490 [Selenomonadaceae bacterium]|nr:hypothetical protein [Selenomonadaceae bacterium]